MTNSDFHRSADIEQAAESAIRDWWYGPGRSFGMTSKEAARGIIWHLAKCGFAITRDAAQAVGVRLATIEECAKIAEYNGWERTAEQIRALASQPSPAATVEVSKEIPADMRLIVSALKGRFFECGGHMREMSENEAFDIALALRRAQEDHEWCSAASGGLPTKSAMQTALRYMELASARHDKDALTVSGSGEGAEIYRDAAKCIAFAMNALPQPSAGNGDLNELDRVIGIFGRATTETYQDPSDRYDAIKFVRDYLFELRQRLTTAAPQSVAWQPIETAPKDKPIMLCVEGFLPCVGRWWPVDSCWASFDWEGHFESDKEMTDHVNGSSYEPTHWSPLPAGPSSQVTRPEHS
jgi:hypothetical protein